MSDYDNNAEIREFQHKQMIYNNSLALASSEILTDAEKEEIDNALKFDDETTE